VIKTTEFEKNPIDYKNISVERYKYLLQDTNYKNILTPNSTINNKLQEIEVPINLTIRSSIKQAKSISLQKWEGVVIEVKEDSFIARLCDLSYENSDEEAEIPFSEISYEDMLILKPGAIFYWSINYLTTISGQLKRESIIIFRRSPVWTKQEIDRVNNVNAFRKIIFGE